MRRNVLVGDLLRDPPANERDFLYQYPDYLVPAQLVIIKWMFESVGKGQRRGRSVPDISAYITGFRADRFGHGRAVGRASAERDIAAADAVLLPGVDTSPACSRLRYGLGPGVGPSHYARRFRPRGQGGREWAAGVAHGAFHGQLRERLGVLLDRCRGWPVGSRRVAWPSNGIPQGTGLTANGTTGFTDPNTELDLEFWIWPTALNVTALGDGSRNLTLLGYTDL